MVDPQIPWHSAATRCLASRPCLFLVSPHSCYNPQDLCREQGRIVIVVSCVLCDIVGYSRLLDRVALDGVAE
jgi:hypothetical protein